MCFPVVEFPHSFARCFRDNQISRYGICPVEHHADQFPEQKAKNLSMESSHNVF